MYLWCVGDLPEGDHPSLPPGDNHLAAAHTLTARHLKPEQETVLLWSLWRPRAGHSKWLKFLYSYKAFAEPLQYCI